MGVAKSKHGKQKATQRKKITEDASVSIGTGTPPESPTSESISPPSAHINHKYSPPNRSNHVTFEKSSHSSVTTSHDGESVVFREPPKKLVRGRKGQAPSNKSVNCGSIRFSVARSVGPELPISENSDTQSKVLLDLEGRKPIKINKYNYICSWLEQAAEVRSQRKDSEDRPSEVDLRWGLRREHDSREFRGHKKRSRSHVTFVRTEDSHGSIDVEPYSTRSDISLTPPRSHKQKRNFQIDKRTAQEQESRRYRPPERTDYRRERLEKDTSRRRRSRRDRKASLESDQEVRRKILRDMERRREDAILTEVPRRRRREVEGRSDRRSSRHSKKMRKEGKRSEYDRRSRGRGKRHDEDYGEDFYPKIKSRNQSRRSSRTHIRDNDTQRVHTAIIETHNAPKGSPEENVENEPGAHSHGDCPGDLQPNTAPYLAATPDLSTLRNLDISVIQQLPKSSPDLIPQQKEEFYDVRSRLNLHRVDNELDLLSPYNSLKRSNPHTSLFEASVDVTYVTRSSNHSAHIGENLEPDVPKSRTLSPEQSNQTTGAAQGDNKAMQDLSSCIAPKKDSVKIARAIEKLASDALKRKMSQKKPKRMDNFLQKPSRDIEESVRTNQRRDKIFVDEKKTINDGNVKHKTAPAPIGKVHKKFSDFSHKSADEEESESESEDYYSEEEEEEDGSAPVGAASKSMGDHWYPSDDDFEDGDPNDIPYNYGYSGYEQPYPYPRPSPTSPPPPPGSGTKEESNGPQISTCGVGGICFKLPGRVTHKTTIKVAHFPRSDPICVNLPSVPQPPPCYPYCCPPPCLPPSCCPPPPDPQKQLNNCNVYNYSGKGQPLSL